MNSSLDSLVIDLPDNDFKYLPEEFSDEFLKLVKQKGVYPYEYTNSFKKFSENKHLNLGNKSKYVGSLQKSSVVFVIRNEIE